MRVRSQEHAEAIYGLVVTIPAEAQPRYKALCHRFPLMIRESGLAAALGFLAAKGKEPASSESLLLRHIATVLGAGDGELLRKTVLSADLKGYRSLTRQALSAGEWFTRYAEALFAEEQASAGKGTATTGGGHD